MQQRWLRQQPGEHPTHCQGPGSPWEQDWMWQHLLVVPASWQKLLQRKAELTVDQNPLPVRSVVELL